MPKFMNLQGMLLTGGTGLQLDSFFNYAGTTVDFLIEMFGDIIAFYIANPAMFLWTLLGVVGLGFKWFSKLF